MKRSAIYMAFALAVAFPACTQENPDGYQGVDMDEGGAPAGPAGTARRAAGDRYGEAATGAVGTDEAPEASAGDGREGPDTVYSPGGTTGPGDTIR